MTIQPILGVLILLAGLFGMGSWVWPTLDGRISWALMFVVGVVILLQGRI